MKLKKDFKKQKWFAYTVASCSAVLLFVSLSNIGVILEWVRALFRVLAPVLEGIVFAYLMHPVCALCERRLYAKVQSDNIKWIASVVTGVLFVLVVFSVLIGALIPQLLESLIMFGSNAGQYAKSLQKFLYDMSLSAQEKGVDVSSLVEKSFAVANDWLGSLPERANDVLTASYNFGVKVANIILAFVLAVYFLLDEDNLLSGIAKLMRALLSPKRYRESSAFWRRCNEILIRFITFDIIDGFIVGACNFVFMLCLSMPYAVLVSVIVGITNLAPTFGPIAGGVIGGFILVLIRPLDALVFILFTLALQTLDGYLIKPRLFGSSLGVPAVWILVTIIIGGNMFGVLGILLAIPFAAIVTYVYRDSVEKRIEEQAERQIAKEEEIQEEKPLTTAD